MVNEINLKKKIEELRSELNELIVKNDDESIKKKITISHKLDALINEYYLKKKN